MSDTSQIQICNDPDAVMFNISERTQGLLAEIDCAARSTHSALILGESGTGKTTVASMIHERSDRAQGPFITVNCAGIPDALIESEFFGYDKGAFTGAVSSKKGLFELAHGGTLFLDEIGELKLELQAKLLTAIEQRKIRRLGSTSDVTYDVRIVSASSRDLGQMVAENTFREDLFYRVSVLEIAIPPLRNRGNEIPLLVHERLTYEQQQASLANSISIEDDALQELARYEWPGNIRQLHNVIARLATRLRGSEVITRSAVIEELARFTSTSPRTSGRHYKGPVMLPLDCRTLLANESLRQFTDRVRRTLIQAVVTQTGNLNAASRRLSVDRPALYRLKNRLNGRCSLVE
jgi:transcriptional regulator with PAS, ATPase and Fis domain